jgi:hypothetical protein
MGIEECVTFDDIGRPTKIKYERNGTVSFKVPFSDVKMCYLKFVLSNETVKKEDIMARLCQRHYEELGCYTNCDGFDKNRNCYQE